MSNVSFCKVCYRITKAEIAYLRFVLESYDGLAFVRTLDAETALVEIAYPADRKADAEALLQHLEKETGMTRTVIPADILYAPL